jgi:hypothetical protein
MPTLLREGLSFCRIGERILFLDLVGDRYFCLASPLEGAFARTCARQGSSEDQAALTAAGILQQGELPAMLKECAHSAASSSMFDETLPQANLIRALMAVASIHSVQRQLRRRGLAATLALLAQRKSHIMGFGNSDPERATARRVSSSFQAGARMSSKHDLCLPSSIAAAHHLLRSGVRADLVIGVTLSPFRAHAWVETGSVVVNEHVEIVRGFTPILVV